MQKKFALILCAVLTTLSCAVLTGCQSATKPVTSNPEPAAATAVAAMPAPAVPVPAAAVSFSAIRIKAGSSTGWTNTDGTVWLPDQGFTDGEVTERPDIQITNTVTPEIYRSEHYSMTSFTYPVPNGKYIVKLHFCETYEGITGEGQRVFSFNVQGKDFKDYDVYKLAGGSLIAHVETVPIEVTDGKVKITFTPNVENPQINAIEILPQP